MNELTCIWRFPLLFCRCHALHCTQLKISPDDVPIVEVHTSSALKGIGAVCRRVIDMIPQPPRGELAASSSSSEVPAAFMLIARSCVVDPVGEEEVAAVAAAAAAGDAITFATIIGRVVQVRLQASVLSQ